MTIPRQREPGRRPGVTTVYRPRLGMWLLYTLLFLAACFLAFVSFYEVHPAWHRLVAIVPVAMLAISLADLRVARVEVDNEAVRIHGILQKGSFAYVDLQRPPEEFALPPGRPVLQQRLSNGRLVRFPGWLGARERRQIIRRIQAHLERPVA